jgi:hypothetical protein
MSEPMKNSSGSIGSSSKLANAQMRIVGTSTSAAHASRNA